MPTSSRTRVDDDGEDVICLDATDDYHGRDDSLVEESDDEEVRETLEGRGTMVMMIMDAHRAREGVGVETRAREGEIDGDEERDDASTSTRAAAEEEEDDEEDERDARFVREDWGWGEV